MEARISSIEGSWDFAGCVMRILNQYFVLQARRTPHHRPAAALQPESHKANYAMVTRNMSQENRTQLTLFQPA
jgi:hypothetical protein